jgi:hypothetical protein
MSDFKRDLRRYIDGLEQPVSVHETMSRRQERRFRVPAAVLAGAAVVLVPALVLIGLRMLPADDSDVAGTTAPPTTETVITDTTTTVIDTTSSTLAPQVQPMVEVPDLYGLTEGEASQVLDDVGLAYEITEMYPSRSGFGTITAQAPLAGETAQTGSTVVIGVRVEARCLSGVPSPEIPEGSIAVDVLFECAGSGRYPDISAVITRAVPNNSNEIEATLRALLTGLTEEEMGMGFASFFSADSASALNSVELTGSRLTVDFNDNIIINNASTSNGSMYFLAELKANLFQFPEIDTIEFQLDGSCDEFWMWLQSSCTTATRTNWEATIAAWTAEMELQPQPGEELGLDDLVGNVFTTELGESGQSILLVDGDDRTRSGFSEVGGWLLDDPAADPASWTNWAIHVTGMNEEMIWLVDSAERTDDGTLVFEVRAVLRIPWDTVTLDGDPFVKSGLDGCTRNGVFDPRLVAMATFSGQADGEMNEVRAWLINIEGGRFVEMPTTGVECIMELGD